MLNKHEDRLAKAKDRAITYQTSIDELLDGSNLGKLSTESRVDCVVYRLYMNVKQGREAIAEFSAELKGDALHALSWGNGMFKTVAAMDVSLKMLHGIKVMRAKGMADDAIMQVLQTEATSNALRGARSPSQSTSVTSNLCEQFTTAAWADFLDQMRFV